MTVLLSELSDVSDGSGNVVFWEGSADKVDDAAVEGLLNTATQAGGAVGMVNEVDPVAVAVLSAVNVEKSVPFAV